MSEWISRTRKRDRSYDSNWGAYEARSGAASGFYRSHQFSNTGNDNRLNADGIIVEGDRVGVPHEGQNIGRQNNNYGRQQSLSYSSQRLQQHPQPSMAASRIRVADYRGSAARIGNLPVQTQFNSGNGSNYQNNFTNSSHSTQKRNNSLPPALASSLAHSLTSPPPTTVSLPPHLSTTLNPQQRSVVESILSGHSTFFTGPAGSGKSHILKTLCAANDLGVSHTGNKRNIVLTATTGVAACSINGTTIHSFAGITPNASDAECVKRIMGNEYAKKRWRECDVLVVDEVSMMGASFLDKLNFVAGRVRNDRRVFGGLQVVLCGDFFQLPPVELAKDGFAFQAKCWPQLIQHSVLLKQVFRQQSDSTLMSILDEARIGELSSNSAAVLRRHGTLPSKAFDSTTGSEEAKIIPTLLECRNKNVDAANIQAMSKLPGEIHTYHSEDRAISDSHRNQLKQCQAPSQLDLKVGAQVLLLKNIDLEKGLANGSRGVVVRFQPPKNGSEVPTGFKGMDLPVVRFDSVKSKGEVEEEDREFTILPEEWQNKMGDQTVSARVQIPLRLAWSISVHKSQGMTIPNLTVNLSGVFEYGQAYVALSRATELRLLTLRGFSEKAFRAHPLVKEFYRMLENPTAAIAAASNKENHEAHHGGEFGELPDPFGGCSNPYQQQQPRARTAPVSNSRGSNPYQNRQPYVQNSSSSYPKHSSSNPYQRPHMNQGMPPAHSNNSKSPTNNSPTLTQDQKRRMEENRQRALAIRMKRQQGS